nr:hypothetical protein [Tanacetum cinerariifolium]
MDTVFDCVVPYIHNASDRNSFSLASRTCYDVDAKTREHVTVHLCYAAPLRCRQRFPFIESLTLAGNPHIVDLASSPCNWDHNLTPWDDYSDNMGTKPDDLDLGYAGRFKKSVCGTAYWRIHLVFNGGSSEGGANYVGIFISVDGQGVLNCSIVLFICAVLIIERIIELSLP